MFEEYYLNANTHNLCADILRFSSSSGGALATLCSLEFATQDYLGGPDMISVYTFGAPKPGNSSFASLYDGVVKSHWRCVVAGDPTVTTPTVSGFVHVGKTAMFTRRGHLTLEKLVRLRWWQSEISSYPMYKLTAYYCAIAAWGESHSAQDAKSIGLWKWPLDKATRDLFSSKPRSSVGPRPGPTDKNALITHGSSLAEDVENPGEAVVTAVAADALEDVVAFTR
jgi:hypothetical protein